MTKKSYKITPTLFGVSGFQRVIVLDNLVGSMVGDMQALHQNSNLLSYVPVGNR